MHHASAGEAHELGVEVGQCLSQILAQTVSLIGVLRHERYDVNIHVARRQHQNLQGCLLAVVRRRQRHLLLLPRVVGYVDGGLGQQFRVFSPSLWLDERNANLLGIALHVTEESREIILGTGFH